MLTPKRHEVSTYQTIFDANVSKTKGRTALQPNSRVPLAVLGLGHLDFDVLELSHLRNAPEESSKLLACIYVRGVQDHVLNTDSEGNFPRFADSRVAALLLVSAA